MLRVPLFSGCSAEFIFALYSLFVRLIVENFTCGSHLYFRFLRGTKAVLGGL